MENSFHFSFLLLGLKPSHKETEGSSRDPYHHKGFHVARKKEKERRKEGRKEGRREGRKAGKTERNKE